MHSWSCLRDSVSHGATAGRKLLELLQNNVVKTDFVQALGCITHATDAKVQACIIH